MKKLLALFFCFFYLGAVQEGFGTVYYVSPTGTNADGLSWATAYTSPAAALAGAPVAGDEVWVQQGTYVSATTLSWKTGINFYGGFAGTESQRSQRSTDASLTILEGNNTNRVLNAPSMAAPTTWSGFTIQKGLSSGGGAGIFMQRNAILENCIVQNNKDTNWGGAGIYIQGGDVDSIKVINCIIRNNITTSTDTRTDKHGGGGIRIRPDASKAVVRNCTIENNVVDGLASSTSGVSGGGVYMAAGTLENSIIQNNTATNKNASTQALSLNGKCQGGGVFIMPQTTTNPIVVRNCTVTGNTANTSVGGGISIDPLWTSATILSPVLIANTFITNNSAYRTGGGIMADGQQPLSTATYTFENCVIANNESSAVAAGGGGAFINNIAGYSGAISFINCTVVNNKMLTTNYGGAGIFYNNAEANISNCVFWGNGSVGALAPYHVRVKTTLTTNKLINCAFDDRFVESQVSPAGFEANLTGLVIISQTNSGSTSGVKYAEFTSPTNFVGKTVTANDLTSFNNSNWLLTATSFLIDAGTVNSPVATDIFGVARPKGSASDIGAYEYSAAPVFVGAGNWESTARWNTGALPGTNESAIVEGAATLTTNVSLQSLTISSGKSLTINEQKQLHLTGDLANNGTLLLKNEAAIRTDGAVSGSGSSTVQQTLAAKTGAETTDNWWYISSPVTGATSAAILVSASGNKMGYYNEPTATYPQITTTNVPLEAGKGYLAQINTAGTYQFTGTLNNGAVGPITLTRTPSAGGPRGFNLVGNPYPSHIDWNAVTGFGTQSLRTDIRPTVWVRTRTASGVMGFDTFDGEDDVTVGVRGEMSRYIAPLQAFWVKVNTDNTTPAITFTNEMRTLRDQSVNSNRLRVKGQTSRSILRLELDNGVNTDKTIISTSNLAQDGYDFYDSDKMNVNSPDYAELFSVVADKELVINKRQRIDAGNSVLLGFRPGKSGSFTIRATELTNLDHLIVVLKDHLTSQEAELQEGVEYTFEAGEIESSGRFSVEFRSPGEVTSIRDRDTPEVLIYVNSDNKITVQSAGLASNELIRVYDLSGQLLADQLATGFSTIIDHRFQSGVYLLKYGNAVQKVIINQ
jgi:hypothetical protein